MGSLNLAISLSFFLIFPSPGALAQIQSPGVSKGNGSGILFTIERSRDADKVYYEIARDSFGRLHTQEPIKVYWILHTQDNQTAPLTRIQRNFSYGLHFKEISPTRAIFQFASSKERDFELKKSVQGEYRVYTQSGNRMLELQKMYIEFAGGTHLLPKIGRVDLYLLDTATGKTVIEALEP